MIYFHLLQYTIIYLNPLSIYSNWCNPGDLKYSNKNWIYFHLYFIFFVLLLCIVHHHVSLSFLFKHPTFILQSSFRLILQTLDFLQPTTSPSLSLLLLVQSPIRLQELQESSNPSIPPKLFRNQQHEDSQHWIVVFFLFFLLLCSSWWNPLKQQQQQQQQQQQHLLVCIKLLLSNILVWKNPLIGIYMTLHQPKKGHVLIMLTHVYL